MATTRGAKGKDGGGVDFAHRPVDHSRKRSKPAEVQLDQFERNLLGDLLAVIEEHESPSNPRIEQEPVERAFVFACERHADQRRRSGEDFIVHPVAVAKICAGMRLDTATLCAALL